LGNKFLAHIREVDAIAEVVRVFEDADIIKTGNTPEDDIEVINLELILADLESVTKRISTVERDAKRGDKEAVAVLPRLEATKKILEANKLVGSEYKDLQLLTSKPILYVFNKKSGGKNNLEARPPRLTDGQASESNYVYVDSKIEQELSEFEGEEKNTFRTEMGVSDDGVNNLITESYKMLGLMSFYTTGEDETRAWTIKIGSTAPEAGAAIHTDFLTKFIRAEVVAYDDLMKAGSYAKARELGLVRTEGKEYIVKDGDIIEFKI
jgi:GTP-binding protein YchF